MVFHSISISALALHLDLELLLDWDRTDRIGISGDDLSQSWTTVLRPLTWRWWMLWISPGSHEYSWIIGSFWISSKNIYIYIKMAQQVGISPGYLGQWWLIIKNWNMFFWGKLFAGPVTGRCSIIIYLIGGIPTPWKYESQIGSSSQLLGKIKAIFQTTNQILQSTYWLLNGAHAKRTDQPMGHSRTSKEIRYLPL